MDVLGLTSTGTSVTAASQRPMLTNILQKPLGAAAVLAPAVGGPYAAFETELGTTLRRALISASSTATSGNSRDDVLPNSTDPYSLIASNRASNMSGWNTQGSIGVADGSVVSPSTVNGNMSGQGGSSWSTNAQGQLVSTVYGPATVVPIGTNGIPNAVGYPAIPNAAPPAVASYYSPAQPLPPPTLETRNGPSSLIPGNTDRLWDYTLGTPTLPQLQQQSNVSVGGGAVHDLREVLRFDITPGWLPQRFARVTTVTSNVQMDGLRVPLITGTQPNDIAGTLTYFFDASQALKRIDLHGLTGDPKPLADLMVQYYQLKPEQSLGGQLFTARWNNRVTSVMQIAPAPIIYAGADHSKYIIFLELNQPSNQYGLSEEASEILKNSQATQRW